MFMNFDEMHLSFQLVYIDKDLHVFINKEFQFIFVCFNLIIDENMKITDFFLRVNTQQ